MTTHNYRVTGMTCDHCVHAVTTELLLVPGVREVNVDLASGAITVVSDAALDRGAVVEAVEEAGYSLIEG